MTATRGPDHPPLAGIFLAPGETLAAMTWTVGRLIDSGRLPARTEAAFSNPMVANLAALLGVGVAANGDVAGAAFMEFVAAVSAHVRDA